MIHGIVNTQLKKSPGIGATVILRNEPVADNLPALLRPEKASRALLEVARFAKKSLYGLPLKRLKGLRIAAPVAQTGRGISFAAFGEVRDGDFGAFFAMNAITASGTRAATQTQPSLLQRFAPRSILGVFLSPVQRNRCPTFTSFCIGQHRSIHSQRQAAIGAHRFQLVRLVVVVDRLAANLPRANALLQRAVVQVARLAKLAIQEHCLRLRRVYPILKTQAHLNLSLPSSNCLSSGGSRQ